MIRFLQSNEGVVAPWGEVSRKKDKKPPISTHTSKPSTPSRGDSRGARGGRGSRGGSGRGGAIIRARGGHLTAAANGHISHNGPHSSTSRSLNDVSVSIDSNKANATEAFAKASNESHDQANGITTIALEGPDPGSQADRIIPSTSLSGTIRASAHAPETPNSVAAVHSGTSKQVSKTPATSKLSWAQIARLVKQPSLIDLATYKPFYSPQEKPTSPIRPSTAEILTPSTSQATIPDSISEPQIDIERKGWENPTTVEVPIWEESKQPLNVETWPPTDVSKDGLRTDANLHDIPVNQEASPSSEPTSETTPVSPLLKPIDTPQTPSVLPLQVISTPSPKLTTRPAVSSYRTSARYKIPDQPVTLPLSFGPGIEKVGMQFGSLSVVDDTSSLATRYVFYIFSTVAN